MKKLVVIVSIFLCLTFCSCTTDTSGYVNELTSKSWSAQLEGGASAELKFSGDTASLILNSGDKILKISGRYIADETSFVIFVPEISQNYSFEYVPRGKTLDLKYNDSTITLNEIKQSE